MITDSKEVYFIKQFKKYADKTADAKTLAQLEYMANQILETGGCGVFNIDEQEK